MKGKKKTGRAGIFVNKKILRRFLEEIENTKEWKKRAKTKESFLAAKHNLEFLKSFLPFINKKELKSMNHTLKDS